MSIFERFNSDRAEATIAQVVVGGMVVCGAFLGINFPGLANMFDLNSPSSNQPYVQEPIEPIEETPVDTTDGEPMGDDWEDPSNTDGSDGEAPIEEPVEETIDEPAANVLNITDAFSCNGDILSQGIGDFSISFNAYLPAGTKITTPSWVYNNQGVYNQDSAIKMVEDNGTDAIFEVQDEGDGFGYASYYFSTSIEFVDNDFKETVKIILPDGFEADSESVLEYELSKDSPYCSIEEEW